MKNGIANALCFERVTPVGSRHHRWVLNSKQLRHLDTNLHKTDETYSSSIRLQATVRWKTDYNTRFDGLTINPRMTRSNRTSIYHIAYLTKLEQIEMTAEPYFQDHAHLKPNTSINAFPQKNKARKPKRDALTVGFSLCIGQLVSKLWL